MLAYLIKYVMIKIITIIGARPQFIKAAAISRAIRNHFSDQIEEIMVHTGQHYDPKMSEVFFEELSIPKEKYNLAVGSNSHALQTADMLVKIEDVVNTEKPNALLVYGDTNSTLAATLVASKMHLPIIHVEAGVRGYNKDLPEEVNRIVCDHLSSLLFVPTKSGMDSLAKENVGLTFSESEPATHNNVGTFLVGDIMYDNTKYFSEIAKDYKLDYFEKNNLPMSSFILATCHRPASTDKIENLKSVFDGILKAAELNGKEVIIPLHPRTEKQLKHFDLYEEYKMNPLIYFAPPASFIEMILLQSKCDLVITDSGGVQKEAYFMKKPCVIMMTETAWVELLTTGTSEIVGTDYDKIVKSANVLIKKGPSLEYPNLYGDGKASEKICEMIIKYIVKN